MAFARNAYGGHAGVPRKTDYKYILPQQNANSFYVDTLGLALSGPRQADHENKASDLKENGKHSAGDGG